MNNTSILSGGKARELFAQLDKSKPTKVADTRSNFAGVTFRLRYCYVRETYGHENFGSKVRYNLSGGMLLTYHIENLPSGFSTLSSGKTRIKADTDQRQEKTVNRAILRVIRMAKSEQMRVWHVEQVDKLAKPFENDPEFLAWVDKLEKKDGKTSDYSSMTREECETWIDRIKNYTKQEPQVQEQHSIEGTYANFDRYIAGDR